MFVFGKKPLSSLYHPTSCNSKQFLKEKTVAGFNFYLSLINTYNSNKIKWNDNAAVASAAEREKSKDTELKKG